MSNAITNPKFLSTNEQPTSNNHTPANQIIDDVDFPHSGLFKVLNLAITGNYATAGFNATAVTNTSITIGEGTVFRQGKIHQVDYANNATTTTLTIPATANRYHLLVNPSNAINTLVIRQAISDNQIMSFTAGDVVIAVLKGGTTPMQIQYLTFNQESNTLSLGRSNSGTYVEGLEIVANASVSGDYDINLKESNGDLAINTQAGTQALRVDGSSGHIRIGGSGTPVSNDLEIAGTSSNSARSPTLELENNNSSPTASRLLFMRQSASLSNNASLGDMVFIARDSGNSSYEYTRIEAQIADETASAGDGRLIFFAQKAGSEAEFIRIDGNDGVVINDGSADIDFRVESNGNAKMLVVDASTDRVGNGTATPDTMLHLKSSGTGEPKVTLENNNDNSVEPQLEFKKNGTSPANNDDLGIIRFVGDDSNGSAHLYAYIKSDAADITAGAENGRIFFVVTKAGTNIELLGISHDEIVINDAGVDTNFRVEGDNNANLLFVDAGNDRVGIGTNAPTASLEVATGGTFRSPRLPTVSVSGSTTLTEATHAGAYLICAGNVTLPATSTAGEHYTILNTTNGNITVSPSVSTNINGGSNGAAITVATYNAVTCIAIGSNNWIALGV